jgi:hypothetical protein
MRHKCGALGPFMNVLLKLVLGQSIRDTEIEFGIVHTL